MPTPQIYQWLASVTDPEVPVLTVLDLGIVRDVRVTEDNEVTVVITPTYSGCPAMDVIGMNIRLALAGRGFRKIHIEMQLRPAWTTDWISPEGRQKLQDYGIAPPQYAAKEDVALFDETLVTCPHCGSADTALISSFGATACKALYKCASCGEPFEHFKCH